MRDRARVTRMGPIAFSATFEQQKPKEKKQARQRWKGARKREVQVGGEAYAPFSERGRMGRGEGGAGREQGARRTGRQTAAEPLPAVCSAHVTSVRTW